MTRVMQFVGHLATWVVGVVLIASGVIHLESPTRFVVTVFKYDILPGYVSAFAGLIIPPIQISIALYLLSRRIPRKASVAAGILIFVFTIGVSFVLIKGIIIDCGCFGAGGSEITIQTVLRNVFLLFLCGLAYFSSPILPVRVRSSH